MAAGSVGSIALQMYPDYLGALTSDDCELQNEELNCLGSEASIFFVWPVTSEMQRTVALVHGVLNFCPSFCEISSRKDQEKIKEGNFIHEEYFKIKMGLV